MIRTGETPIPLVKEDSFIRYWSHYGGEIVAEVEFAKVLFYHKNDYDNLQSFVIGELK